MFKPNKNHDEQSMFPVRYEMDYDLREELNAGWAGLFYRKVFSNINELQFASLYHPFKGRSNFPVNILVGMEILKEMFSLTDEQLLARYRFDLAFRYSLGLEDINSKQMAVRTLYYFRASIAELEEQGNDLIKPVFDRFRDILIEELGIKTGLQRSDSVMIGANAKRLNRVMLFHKVLSNLADNVKESGYALSPKCEELLKKDEDGFCYRLTKENYEAKTVEIGEEIYRLLTENVSHIRVRKQKSFRQGLRLLKEQCQIYKSSGITLKPSVEIKASSMQTPVDDEATYREKNGKKNVGYKVNAVETCDPENLMQVITSIVTAPNNTDDAELFRGQLKELKEITDIDTAICDGAYSSKALREECGEDVQLILSAVRGVDLEVIKEKASLAEYIIVKTGEFGTCPGSQAPKSIQNKEDGTVVLRFDHKICNTCNKKGYCLACVSKTQSRLVIDAKRRWMDEFLKVIGTDDGQFLMNLRSAVEGLMGLMKPKYLCGRILFRGLKKINIRMLFRGIGVNFKRYQGYVEGDMRKAGVLSLANQFFTLFRQKFLSLSLNFDNCFFQ